MVATMSKRRLWVILGLVGVSVAAAIIAFVIIDSTTSSTGGVSPGAGLHVSGNRLLDGRGQPVQFHGVDRSGTEYTCIHGLGVFDGPGDGQSVQAMAGWHVNAVRVPLNEDCWLGINGVKPQYAGVNYRQAIVNYVRLLHRYGMYVELSLIWAAPGAYPATYQAGAPDEDHAPAVWSSMASTFKNDPNVVLAPWGETVTDAKCFLSGGVCEATFGPHNVPYRTAGMQQAVDVMRRAGYRGVISIPGVAFANDLSKWLVDEPKDPDHQLIAEAHVYGKNTCDTTQCFNTVLAPVAKRVPLIFGETGESYDATDCGSSRVATFIQWADAHDVGYDAWAWDTWNNCSSLIASYNTGQPYGPYGSWIKTHYASVPVQLLPAQSRG
jgi:hypothetical protein